MIPVWAGKAFLASDTPFHPPAPYSLAKLFILPSPNQVLLCFHAFADALYSAWMSSLFSADSSFKIQVTVTLSVKPSSNYPDKRNPSSLP